jgi:hypothetical protein
MKDNKELVTVNGTPEQMHVDGQLMTVPDGAMTFGFENPAQSLYTSLPNDGSRETAIGILNAISAPSLKLQEVTDPINVNHIVVHMVTLLNEQTGELEDVPRVVLIGEDGTTYDAVSKGVMSSLRRIMGLVGVAPWTPALKLKPRRVKTRNGFYTLTLDVMV